MDDSVKYQINKIKEDCKKLTPLVVIRCITYNQEAYIRDALEGFVNQQTTFPFVAIVHDDASTDGTASIVKEFADKYPNIIKPIYETKNQYSKRDGSLGKIVRSAVNATGAKYIALCEGDDYWIDAFKIQKQVDFLEENCSYAMCYTDFDILYSEKNICYGNAFETGYHKRPLSFETLLLEESYIAPPTWMVKAEAYPVLQGSFVDGSFAIALELFANHGIGYLPYSTAVYRINAGSITHMKDPNSIFNRRLGIYLTQEQFILKYRSLISDGAIRSIKKKKYKKLWLLACSLNKLKSLQRLNLLKEDGLSYRILNMVFNNKLGREGLLSIFKRRQRISL